MTVFSRPGSAGALMSYESRYQNFIGGQWVAPVHGRYFENPTPVTGQPFCESAGGPRRSVDSGTLNNHNVVDRACQRLRLARSACCCPGLVRMRRPGPGRATR